MKKYSSKILALLLSLAMLLSMVPAMTFTASAADGLYSGGNGTEEDPYQISSREDLEAIAEAVNGGNDLKGLYFKQTCNIDMGGADEGSFPVIGHVIDNAPHPFNGVYDGGDFEVRNLYVYRKNDDAGLFGFVGPSGVLRRIHVVDCDISGSTYVGGVAGRNYGLVEYCSSSGEVHGSWQYAGGIVGFNQYGGKISYCYSDCDVLGNQFVGGIAGSNSASTIVNCYFRGYVYGSSNVRTYVGGIVGENRDNGTVDNCYSDGDVYGKQYAGAIAGSNGLGSSVEDCFYQQDPEDDTPGISDNKGTAENVTPKTDEQFASGEVAWELSRGTDGDGWGQNLGTDGVEADEHPHFLYAPDKPNDTSAVYRVTFKANYNSIDEVLYVDPGVDVELPEIPENSKWYVKGEEFDGKDIQEDKDAVAGERILFGGEAETVTVSGTYSTAEQKLAIDLDQYMGYAEKGPSAEGRFEYTILEDKDNLNAVLSIDGKSLTVPEGTNVKEGGYMLTVNAHEKEPYIATLSLGPFGTEDVTLNVNVMINKADPKITILPTTSSIDYEKTLADSALTDGEAQHPVTGVIVTGSFTWVDTSIVPPVVEAASVGYPILFTPDDTNNYNNANALDTLTVNKIDPTDVVDPTPINGVYDGSAHELVTGGSANGGTMKYWLAEDAAAEAPDPDAEYSSTIPSRANAGTYKIWYKVVGDENHNDTEPKCVTAVISPYPLTILDQHFTYNGANTFTLALEGVKVDGEDTNRTVIATLTADRKDAGEYAYAAEAGSGKYTVELSNSNYIVAEGAGMLTVDKLAAIFSWSEVLTFTYDGEPHEVTATVSNAVSGDEFDLKFEENNAESKGDYTARVISLGNDNYTLDNAQNATQAWHILPESEKITLSATEQITYGDSITLTADIAPITPVASTVVFRGRVIHLMSIAAADTVDFYVNGNLVGSVEVNYDNDDRDSGTASLTIDATAANSFSAGANAVKAEYGGNGNVTEAESTALTVNVAAKPIDAEIVGDSATKTYDGNDIATGLDIALNGDDICANGEGKDDVSVTADTYTYNSPNVKEANIITANNVTLVGAQSSNYVLNNAPSMAGSIDPKVIGLEWRGSSGLVYSGNPVNVNATAIKLIPGFDCAVSVENGQQINAGDYTATAESLDNSNYTLPAVGTTQDYTISPAPLYIPEQTVSYDGSTAEFDVEPDGVTPADGITEKVSAKLTASSANAGYYSYVAERTDDAEDKTYTASTDNTNYEIAGGAMLIISKIDPLYTAPIANALVYNDEWQELITAGEAIGGTMKYSLSQDGDYEETIPTGLNAGDYTVWFKVFGDENHNDTEAQAVTVTIAKADPIINPVPRAMESLVYNGYPQELVARGRVYGGELLYSLSEDGPYSTDVPTGIEVGSYTVWYMVIGDSNHNDIAPQAIEATIAQKDIGDEPGDDPGNEPGDEPGNEPGNEPGDDPGNEPGNEPGNDPGNEPGNDPGNDPGSEPGNDPGNDPGNKPGNDPGNEPGNDPGNESGNKPGDNSGDQPGNDSEDDPGNDPENNPGSDPGSESDSNSGDKSGSASDGNHNSSLTSPKTGAATFAFAFLAMLMLSAFILGGMKFTALRRGKRSK